jgi:hypothetical protein
VLRTTTSSNAKRFLNKEDVVVYKEDRNAISMAIKADIVEQLARSEIIGVFELRRIGQIATLAIDLVNSLQTPSHGVAYVETLKRITDICPHMNEVLQQHIFDGEAVLKEGYERLLGRHHDMQREALSIQQARQALQLESVTIDNQRRAVEAERQLVLAETERLKQLSALNAQRADSPDSEAIQQRLVALGADIEAARKKALPEAKEPAEEADISE